MNKEEVVELIDSNNILIQSLIHQKVQIWKEYVLCSDLWWLGVILSIVPWVIWFYFRNKQSTDRIMYAGLFVMVISLLLDILGDQLGFWHYRFNVIPVLPTYFPWDITLMPVTIMLLIQIKPQANPYLKALLFALLTSYVAEPFITRLMVYNPINWDYSYSVPLQFVIYLIAHAISQRDRFQKLA